MWRAPRPTPSSKSRHCNAEPRPKKRAKRSKDPKGQRKLPNIALGLVMEALVDQLEPEGIIGPSMMAGWVANAALVRQRCCCWMKRSRCSGHECFAICTNQSLLPPSRSVCVSTPTTGMQGLSGSSAAWHGQAEPGSGAREYVQAVRAADSL
jgi:hypothetical protein